MFLFLMAKQNILLESKNLIFVEKSFGNYPIESLLKKIETYESRLVGCETHCTDLGPSLVLYKICKSVTLSFTYNTEE